MAKVQPLDVWEEFDPNKTIDASRLSEFLDAPEMTVSREKMFNHLLFFELKFAAASCNYNLQMYQPEVDRDGHDIILEDNYRLASIQTKTVVGNTESWRIRKRLLRPETRYISSFGLTEPEGGEFAGISL